MDNLIKGKFAFVPLEILSSYGKVKFMMGFSLVEMMMVILVSLLILAAVYMVYLQGTLSWYTTDTNIEVTGNARQAMDAMIKELANSATGYCTVSTAFSTNDTITFRMPSVGSIGNITWGNGISYFRGGTANRQLIRTEASLPDRILCNNLEDTDIDGNGIIGIGFNKIATAIGTIVTVTLETRKTSIKGNVLSATLINNVKLRNQ